MSLRTGRIYKIISLEGDECYIGSTFNTTRDRFKQHKYDYGKWRNGKHTSVSIFSMFDKYTTKGCKIVLIKEYQVVDRNHLRAYEQLWINRHSNSVNKIGTIKLLVKQKSRLYRENNKDVLRTKNKRYREENKDVIRERNRVYNEKNKDTIREREQKYYKKNRDAILEKQRLYRENNKDTINSKRKIKMICDCGSCVRKSDIAQHKKSKKHLNWESQKSSLSN